MSQNNTYNRSSSPQECQPLMAPAVAPLPGYLGYIAIQISRSLKNSEGLLCVTDGGTSEKRKTYPTMFSPEQVISRSNRARH